MRPSKQARTHRRWREQAARLIALADPGIGEGPVRLGILGFDVARVRAYAERLLAEGERLSEEREVFADWTRDRGLGPETFPDRERGACCGGAVISWEIHGGWPGPLAREWGTVECMACEGKGRFPRLDGGPELFVELDGDPRSMMQPVAMRSRGFGKMAEHRRTTATHVRCKPCRGRGRLPHPDGFRRAAPNGGAWMVRAARRLLDTLDGRCPWAPSAAGSKCQRCEGTAAVETPSGARRLCHGCRGTGHSLFGVLPPVEWSPTLRRKLADMPEGTHEARAASGDLMDWIDRLIEHGGEALLDARDTPPRTELDALDDPARPLAWIAFVERRIARGWRQGGIVPVEREATRVVPRGEHRNATRTLEAGPEGDFAESGRRICRGWSMRVWTGALANDRADAHIVAFDMTRLPRWRRGELRHAEQRRRRAARPVVEETVAAARAFERDDRIAGVLHTARAAVATVNLAAVAGLGPGVAPDP